ncbi:thiamine diphosphokinase [Isachenkonia alkalipeptolytica]|uniref:Thiamine diphosphokinase n=1 Tax=Isachenkonia alkalipeptolytica TaxID=2565777 RepID=A0AA43XLP1_9CLOT|nr:thiamine diphosphokinase [Isachenkonia alkalipeptolytica]NBG89123.1 thiamine diphosphokinase [Isachenkonia alkalipeptolytica]
MNITIVTNGKIENLSWLKGKLKENAGKGHSIICADGASKYLRAIDFVPDLLVGDMDSIDPEGKKWMEKNRVPLKKFPSRKDQTDTEIALEYSVSKKPEKVEILGAFGSRMDHTLGNIQLLEGFFDSDISIVLLDEENEIWLLKKHTTLRGRKNENFSILAITESVGGITLKGFEYPLENHTLYRGHTLGISNIIRTEEAEISYREGKLLGIIARD